MTVLESSSSLNLARAQELLSTFDFTALFVEQLGWQNPPRQSLPPVVLDSGEYTLSYVAAMSGFAVVEVSAPDGLVPDKRTRKAVYDAVAKTHYENILIFVDQERTDSDWYWVKREPNGRRMPRDHYYARGQSGELFLGKLVTMAVELSELDETGTFPLARTVERVNRALDVEQVTKRFYREYTEERLKFIELIEGISDEKDRRWYASVLLNRLMFIYFLQKKGFVDNADGRRDYLGRKLRESKLRGEDRYYSEFLDALFFEGFAKPPRERDPAKAALIGDVKYLNGGLFVRHRIELDERYKGKIRIPDAAFESIVALFEHYSWNYDDTRYGNDRQLNPHVLGYIFEKYINQKALGAYYTRPEITKYLCEQTINRLVLDRVNAPAGIDVKAAGIRRFDDIRDLSRGMDAELCQRLLNDILPSLAILDPACGSGAFLVASMQALIEVYVAVIGRIPFLNDAGLKKWYEDKQREHPSIGYYIRRSIITNNIFGVDIVAEGAEIARLRLFLELVSMANTVDELEPLPNIDFNILQGNSLVGLLRVTHDVDNLFGSFAEEVAEKNRLVEIYRHANENGYVEHLEDRREVIDKLRTRAYKTLDDLLLEEFKGIKYEQATWDEEKQTEGKPKKRDVRLEDVQALEPFHWGYEFDDVMNRRGGFDAIITNPPWDIFKPNSKEFFQEYATDVTINKMTIKEFETRQAELLKQPALRGKWLEYLSRFPHVSAYYRAAKQYENQISVVNGKKAGTDINLYKLFTEQCFNLLRRGGQCGIVIPSGIYTDLGTKQLREMLFGQTQVTGLFCFENGKPGGGAIFENVHRSFKFVLLSFDKSGLTRQFPAAFMRHEVAELELFPQQGAIEIAVDSIRRSAPDSLSLTELQSLLDVEVQQKLEEFPTYGEANPTHWNLKLGNELHMTGDKKLFHTVKGQNHLALYEGKMVNQFTHNWKSRQPRYWIDEGEGRKALDRNALPNQELSYQRWRLAHRSIASTTNERSMIASIIPANTFFGHSLNATTSANSGASLCYAAAVLNSFVFDYSLRSRGSMNITMFIVQQAPFPHATATDPRFRPIVERAARLICTTPEFDALAKEVGLTPLNGAVAAPGGLDLQSDQQSLLSEQPALGDAPEQERPVYGVTDPAGRAKLRAELDAMVAHLYTLTEDEFAHILGTFPLVEQSVKDAALEEFRRQAPGAGDPEIARLLKIKERHTLEFKECLRHNTHTGQRDTSGENKMTKDVASFLNSPQGGTLLTGVTDDGEVVGIESDYPFLGNDGHEDGYQMALAQALQNACGAGVMNWIDVTFHEHFGKTVCKLAVSFAPEPVYWKEGGVNKFVIRQGNQSVVVQDARAIIDYQNRTWPKVSPS